MGYRVMVLKNIGWWDCVYRGFNQDEAGKITQRWSQRGYEAKMEYVNLEAGV